MTYWAIEPKNFDLYNLILPSISTTLNLRTIHSVAEPARSIQAGGAEANLELFSVPNTKSPGS
jgi:hypothetical protein